MYVSDPLNVNLVYLHFNGNQRLITGWLIYHINDDIVESLNNGYVIDVNTQQM